MSTYPKPGYCVHCGLYFKALTWDHVFPKSWYPDTSPLDVEKWQIPSCKQCNKDYGKLEEELLIKIGLCLDPSDYRSSGIADKVLRALNPSFAHSNKDRRVREGKRRKILREAMQGDQIPFQGLFPNFDRADPGWTEPPIAVLLKADDIRKFTTKIVKGITFIEDGYIINEPYRSTAFTKWTNLCS
jgi:hypothetical protein